VSATVAVHVLLVLTWLTSGLQLTDVDVERLLTVSPNPSGSELA
jgi:hypothetical protein